ncbi:hypothetical protein EDD85DRAFT_797553 [Armillaria nabsnona]|nr:hypothetical protein EDD85DRAFT_797553 [Armillaria nabsnona]
MTGSFTITVLLGPRIQTLNAQWWDLGGDVHEGVLEANMSILYGPQAAAAIAIAGLLSHQQPMRVSSPCLASPSLLADVLSSKASMTIEFLGERSHMLDSDDGNEELVPFGL